MTTVQKGIVCSVLLVGLQLAAGCFLQNQSRATASVEPQTSDSPLGLRDRLQDRVQERVSEKLSATAGSTDQTAHSLRIAQRNAPAVNKIQLVNVLADQVVNRVNQSSCKDFQSSLNRLQDQPKNQNSAMKARLLDSMKANPELRRTFIDAIAGPLANKMFDCGLI